MDYNKTTLKITLTIPQKGGRDNEWEKEKPQQAHPRKDTSYYGYSKPFVHGKVRR